MELIRSYQKLSLEEIDQLYSQIEQLYNTNLKQFNIKLPAKNTNKMYQLIYLFYFQGKAVHKDVITTFVQEHNPKASGDQQIRHLSAQNGYYILGKGGEYNYEKVPSGYYMLITLTEPNPNWCNNIDKRRIALKDNNFDSIKKAYDYRCATCGEKEGNIHRYTGKKVILQKGHMNPNKPLTIDNIIPQCEYCNQNVYKNDFIFDEKGHPKSINNPNYILKSTEETQKQMLEILLKKFEV